MKPEEIAKIIEEKDLAQKLNACETAEDALAVLKEAGAEVTPEELEAFYNLLRGEAPTGELSDDDLENVAGGLGYLNKFTFLKPIIKPIIKPITRPILKPVVKPAIDDLKKKTF